MSSLEFTEFGDPPNSSARTSENRSYEFCRVPTWRWWQVLLGKGGVRSPEAEVTQEWGRGRGTCYGIRIRTFSPTHFLPILPKSPEFSEVRTTERPHLARKRTHDPTFADDMGDGLDPVIMRNLADDEDDGALCYGCGATAQCLTGCMCDLFSFTTGKLSSQLCHVPFPVWQRARENVRRILVRKFLLFSIAVKVLREEFAVRARAQEVARKRFAPGGAGALAAENHFYTLSMGDEEETPSSKRARLTALRLDFPSEPLFSDVAAANARWNDSAPASSAIPDSPVGYVPTSPSYSPDFS